MLLWVFVLIEDQATWGGPGVQIRDIRLKQSDIWAWVDAPKDFSVIGKGSDSRVLHYIRQIVNME